jgi:hypothetical protein
MFIFNWGDTAVENEGRTYPIYCQNCANEVFYDFVKIEKRAGVFFVPLFSYDSESWLLCPVCGVGYELRTRDEVEAARSLKELTKSYLQGRMTEEKYLERKQDFEANFLQQRDVNSEIDVSIGGEEDGPDLTEMTPDVEVKGVELCTQFDEANGEMTVTVYDDADANRVELIVGGSTVHTFRSPSAGDTTTIHKTKYQSLKIKVNRSGYGG